MVEGYLKFAGFNSPNLKSGEGGTGPWGKGKISNPTDNESDYTSRVLDDRLSEISQKRFLNARYHQLATDPQAVYQDVDEKLSSLADQYKTDYAQEMTRLKNIPGLSLSGRTELAVRKAELNYRQNLALYEMVSPVEADIDVLTKASGKNVKDNDRLSSAKAETLVSDDEKNYLARKHAKAQAKYAAKSAKKSKK